MLARLREVTANAFAEVFLLTTAAADSWGHTHMDLPKVAYKFELRCGKLAPVTFMQN